LQRKKEAANMKSKNMLTVAVIAVCVFVSSGVVHATHARLIPSTPDQPASPESAGSEQAPAQSSQTTAYHYVLPLNLALEAATEAIHTCAQNGYAVSATVVDMDGVPQLMLRGDGATIHTHESSFDKAYTVVTLGPIFNFDTTGKFLDMTKTNPYAPRLAAMTNVMALPGAVAFKSKNAIVAALGVGGAPGGDKDEVCAHAGVAKVADRLPN
jgi:uncharacterized protein GlcG (DUF336 family)